MKLHLALWLILCFLNSFAQNSNPKELGVGFAIAANPYEFDVKSIPSNLFIDQNLTQKWKIDSVFPYFLKPDYGLYHFICLAKTEKYYKVLVNDNDIGYIPNDASFNFITWDSILKDASVERLPLDNPIMSECNDSSKTILYYCEFERLKVVETLQKDGEYWLKVYFSPVCEDYFDQDSDVIYGWIKWRSNNQLLIEIYLLC